MNKSFLYNKLTLAFPPISAKIFAQLKNQKGFKETLEYSHLYIIAQREDLYFTKFERLINPVGVYFEIYQNGTRNSLQCMLPLFQENLATNRNIEAGIAVEFYENPKSNNDFTNFKTNIIKVFEIQNGKDMVVLTKMSPEVLLYNVVNGLLKAEIYGNIEDFLKYKVHYVGKSTEQNICERLTGHSTLQDVLSLERPFSYGTIPSNEITLLIFEVEDDFLFHISECEDDLVDILVNYNMPASKTLALDAEKALIRALNPNYNKIKFSSYPTKKDLINTDIHDVISYRLSDPITLIYANGAMKGNQDPFLCDFIDVDRKGVE